MAPGINKQKLVNTTRQYLHAVNMNFSFNQLKYIMTLVALFVVFCQLLIMVYPSSSPVSLQTMTSGTAQDLVLVLDENMPVSTYYGYLLEKFSENFPSKPLEEKCALYFDELYKRDENWEVMDPDSNADKDYQMDSYDHDRYIRRKSEDWKNHRKDEWKKEHGELPDELPDELKQEPPEDVIAGFENDFITMRDKSFKIEQNIVDAVTHLRVFGKCYLNYNSPISSLFGTSVESTLSDGSTSICEDVEQRLFPWLSKEFPTFKRWDGTLIKGIPRMSNYIKYDDDEDIILGAEDTLLTPEDVILEPQDKDYLTDDGSSEKLQHSKLFKRSTKSKCFMNDWRNALNGRGIILSVADKYKDDVIGLIKVLRALNNRLPIQVVHKGDLSESAQDELIEAARADDPDVPLYVYEKVRDFVPHNFPKQEIWFVNANRCIKKEYRDRFGGYANKLIAFLFNSFDETILFDTDSVPFVKPSYFFDMGPYQRTGILFFKDRYTDEHFSDLNRNFMLKLFPTAIDEALFDIPRTTNFTLNNRYIKEKSNHFMEAGIVAMRRPQHFAGILTMIQLNLWKPVTDKIHGEKELFWIGQSAAGDENYEFNKHDVVSAGIVTSLDTRPKGAIANEICSTHPGHLSGEDDYTLLWVNSGMKYCKISGTWDRDVQDTRYKNDYKTAEDLKKMYNGPVRINAVLHPPGGDLHLPNNFEEPEKGWYITHYCKNYLWCAYDVIGASFEPVNRGFIIHYDQITENKIEYIGKLWLLDDLSKLSEYRWELERDKENKIVYAAKKAEEEEEEKKKQEEEEKKKKEEEEKKKKEEEDKQEEEEENEATETNGE
ncbi:alpha-mannosyltransferase CYBJADRAFT_98267 [Cyberlindnera jadinii NRRL Y-1542]|uniref:Nucleotide-diphospho-sugar transferase n=2 Tax=Saccharomycetes TaxID=4891 RepID=A0A1E4RZK9_CYBJN|nr:hypothetical protein CYBJADRAFT_98267 [Cyberlindnera jadinii NRRL Y-1542]ODV72678.1 hypothetical protein CYBJADRAFT_98267 [Cyberlindnera jadinii NRRL Y-1542]